MENVQIFEVEKVRTTFHVCYLLLFCILFSLLFFFPIRFPYLCLWPYYFVIVLLYFYSVLFIVLLFCRSTKTFFILNFQLPIMPHSSFLFYLLYFISHFFSKIVFHISFILIVSQSNFFLLYSVVFFRLFSAFHLPSLQSMKKIKKIKKIKDQKLMKYARRAVDWCIVLYGRGRREDFTHMGWQMLKWWKVEMLLRWGRSVVVLFVLFCGVTFFV